MIANSLGILAGIILFLSPIWVIIHSWRKGYKTLAIIISIAFLIPFVPQVIAFIAFFIVKPYKPNWNYMANPQCYVGCGTKFFGATDRSSDGSFITTQWFCIFFIPIIPIQSYRVLYRGSNTVVQGAIITSTDDYLIIENGRINGKQVLQALIFILSFFVLITLMFLFLKSPQISQKNDIDTTIEVFTSAIIGLLIIYVIIGYYLLKAK